MKKRYISIVILTTISILIFLNNEVPPLKVLTQFIQNISSIPKSLIYNFKTSVYASDSSAEQVLKKQNAELIEKLVNFDKLKQDNEALRGQFENSKTAEYKLIPAHIIGFLGRFSNPIELIIDQGQDSGIKVGMAVVSKESLVGKIAYASPKYSRLALPQSGSFSTIAKTLDNGSLGVVKGQDDFILFDGVSINDKISQGEILVSKGEINDLGIGIPDGLVIGKLEKVNKNEALPFQTAKVSSLIDFSKISTVFVILGLK